MALLLALVCVGCAGQPSRSTPPSAFRIVDREDVHLNGIENGSRPPISFFLVGGRAGADDEAALVDAVVESMRRDGWRVEAFSIDQDGWTFYGGRGSEVVRVGPATRFAELARAEEGYARTRFRRLVAETDEPLVIMSVDLQP